MDSSMLSSSCRCCASEGAYKDVKSSYHWMGEEEIYADMLKECFDVTLSPASDGLNEGGICEICITQLRNAANFKKQVLHTEEQFKNKLQSGFFKPEIVKVEVPGEDGNDTDDNNASVEEGFSGPEFDVPIKSESPEEPKAKKRAAKKGPTTRAKKAKSEDAETSTKRIGCETTKIKIEPKVSSIIKTLKATTTKLARNNDWSVTLTKPKSMKENIKNQLVKINLLKREIKEIDKHLHNIRTILLCSNATPIRSHDGIGYSCCFCSEQYPDPVDLKEHTLEKHDITAKSKFMMGHPMPSYVVKLDITRLRCLLCGVEIDGLERLTEHLKTVHDKNLYTDINSHILPFKFEGDTFVCVFCSKIFERFKLIQEHMNVHYRNYICDICHAFFVNKRTHHNHSKRHKQGEFACAYCTKIFDTQSKKANHEKFVHIRDQKRNKCPHCHEKFISYAKKMQHMVTEHGAQPVVLKCRACDRTFSSRDRLTRHTKRDHLLERRHECSHCEMKFYGRKDLLNHMIKHTGVREYRCDVCLKAYGRKHTLREHLRIHADDRRFKCKHCGQAFVQKCSWKSHMRSKHGEMVH